MRALVVYHTTCIGLVRNEDEWCILDFMGYDTLEEELSSRVNEVARNIHITMIKILEESIDDSEYEG